MGSMASLLLSLYVRYVFVCPVGPLAARWHPSIEIVHAAIRFPRSISSGVDQLPLSNKP